MLPVKKSNVIKVIAGREGIEPVGGLGC